MPNVLSNRARHKRRSSMKLLKAKVQWNLEWANSPSLDLLVDHLPSLKEMQFEKKGGSYYAENEGYVEFFHYNGPDRGFGGHHFHLTMKNGKEEILIGPWSSRAGAMNSKFGPCVDVSITDNPQDYEAGYFCAGHVTLSIAEEAAKLAGCFLCRVPSCDEATDLPDKEAEKLYHTGPDLGPTWIPTIDPTGKTVRKLGAKSPGTNG